MAEIVTVCRTLPDFDALQIVHYPFVAPLPRCRCRGTRIDLGLPTRERKLALREEVNGVKEWAIDCFKKPKAGCREEEVGGKKTVVRVIELCADRLHPNSRLGSVKVMEYEV